MEHLVTSPARATVQSITEVVVEPSVPVVSAEQRRRRIARLRDAIESGDYCVSASNLADAMLRTARRAN